MVSKKENRDDGRINIKNICIHIIQREWSFNVGVFINRCGCRNINLKPTRTTSVLCRCRHPWYAPRPQTPYTNNNHIRTSWLWVRFTGFCRICAAASLNAWFIVFCCCSLPSSFPRCTTTLIVLSNSTVLGSYYKAILIITLFEDILRYDSISKYLWKVPPARGP